MQHNKRRELCRLTLFSISYISHSYTGGRHTRQQPESTFRGSNLSLFAPTTSVESRRSPDLRIVIDRKANGKLDLDTEAWKQRHGIAKRGNGLSNSLLRR